MKDSDEYVSDFSQMSRQYLPMHSWQEKTFLGNQNNTKGIVILPSFQPVETRISQKSVFADRLWETKKCILRIDKIHYRTIVQSWKKARIKTILNKLKKSIRGSNLLK